MSPRFFILTLSIGSALSGCRHQSEGEQLARTYCAACHVFPTPGLLDKETWANGVLPQMAPRLGVSTGMLYDARFRNPDMVVLSHALTKAQFQKIVAYYEQSAPTKLPAQPLPAQPELDSTHFDVRPFAPGLPSSGIVTLLDADSIGKRIYIGEAVTNTLRVFDWKRHLLTTVRLPSPPTSVITDGSRVFVLESGILDPNDRPAGSLVEYDDVGDSLRFAKVLVDSLYRPVFAREADLAGDGSRAFVICEFGNNRGRLAVYKYDGQRYRRQVLDAGPGAIHFEIRDLTGDGAPDIVALFAQGDERIVLFENDGHGNFPRSRILARFPPVYGSMYFSMHDFNGDGKPDILYVNGDNFDFSRILKPYHGVRILENDGRNNFHERYFFPIYGAAQAVVGDFAHTGRLDILATSNFADPNHPERGIMYLQNRGGYHFQPYAFLPAAGNQWNVMAAGDFDGDGRLDVLVGAMNLATVARVQQRFTPSSSDSGRTALLLFEPTASRTSQTRR
jgi:VCBS repeat protein